MQQASELHPQDGRLEVQGSRSLHSPRAAWWFRLLARAGPTQFFLYLLFSAIFQYVDHSSHGEFSIADAWRGQVLAGLATLASVVYSYKAMGDPKPPRRRIARRYWRVIAGAKGFAVAFGAVFAALAFSDIILWTTVSLRDYIGLTG